MAYHSENGQKFLGLRSRSNGRHQVIYDAMLGQRILFDIKDSKANLQAIDEALREGVRSRNILYGLLKALNRCNIGFEYPS